jgi:predicted PurR-regulated permease PerM
MESESKYDQKPDTHEEWFSRQRVQSFLLVVVTAIAVYLCYLLVLPFLPALAWALAFSVLAAPLYRWIAARVHRTEVAAGITVFIVALVLVGPIYFVAQQIVIEGTEAVRFIRNHLLSGDWRTSLANIPWLASLYEWIASQIDLAGLAQRLAEGVSGFISTMLSGSVELLMQLLITFFVLFYFLRDRSKATNTVRSLLPLSRSECDRMFTRIVDTIYATVFGTLLVSMIQGALGGLMFWWLGLPAPLLWGIVMGLLGIVPVLGAFVVWIPAAITLALNGEWVKALILSGWGMIVIGLIDNLLYPILVGNRLRLHTLPVFFSILGGLALFGTSGLILGPVVLAITDGLMQIWKKRIDVQEQNEHEVAEGAAPEVESA